MALAQAAYCGEVGGRRRLVIADTFLRFKGLERPFVIITEVTLGKISRYETRMYIALTRATVSAIVVCSEAAIAADPRLRDLAESSMADS